MRVRKESNRQEGQTIIVNGATERVGNYLKKNNVNLSDLSRKTGISYSLLYASVWDKNRLRDLRVDEFLSVCEALKISADIFRTGDSEDDE